MIKVNGEPLDWQDGLTVRGVLRARNYRFPLLVVTINDVLVSRPNYDTTEVPDGADVKVIHLMSGG